MNIANVVTIILKALSILLPWASFSLIILFDNDRGVIFRIGTAGVVLGIILHTVLLSSIFVKDIIKIMQKDKVVEHKTLELAKNNHGILTEKKLALEAGVTIKESKKYLELLVVNGQAEMHIGKEGSIFYEFKNFVEDNTVTGQKSI